jgi:hypothetical protein
MTGAPCATITAISQTHSTCDKRASRRKRRSPRRAQGARRARLSSIWMRQKPAQAQPTASKSQPATSGMPQPRHDTGPVPSPPLRFRGEIQTSAARVCAQRICCRMNTQWALSSMVEQGTHNPWVGGSSPSGPTICAYAPHPSSLMAGAFFCVDARAFSAQPHVLRLRTRDPYAAALLLGKRHAASSARTAPADATRTSPLCARHPRPSAPMSLVGSLFPYFTWRTR